MPCDPGAGGASGSLDEELPPLNDDSSLSPDVSPLSDLRLLAHLASPLAAAPRASAAATRLFSFSARLPPLTVCPDITRRHLTHESSSFDNEPSSSPEWDSSPPVEDSSKIGCEVLGRWFGPSWACGLCPLRVIIFQSIIALKQLGWRPKN